MMGGGAESSPGSASLASSSDASPRFSRGSAPSMEFDDDDESEDDPTYHRMQSECEEIPSSRWMTPSLRWWRTRKKGGEVSKRSASARVASSGTEVVAGAKTTGKLVPFDDHLACTLEDLLTAPREVLGKGSHGTVYLSKLGNGNEVAVKRLRHKIMRRTSSASQIQHSYTLPPTWGRGRLAPLYMSAYKRREQISPFNTSTSNECKHEEAQDFGCGGSGIEVTNLPGKFEAEVEVLGRIRHPNLLALRAYYYFSEDDKFLVLDYMPNGSLFAFMHGEKIKGSEEEPFWHSARVDPQSAQGRPPAHGPDATVDWPTRMNIAVGITRGLHHLHTHENMVHGNLTSGNVLLDDHINAKIADYGLSCLGLFHGACEALGYCAPEHFQHKKANFKTDVYSLGVIMLELLTGKSPREAIQGLHLPQWVAKVPRWQWTDEVLDPGLTRSAERKTLDELLKTLELALRCTHPSPNGRPEVLQVLQQLDKIKLEMASDATTKGWYEPADKDAGIVGTMATAAPNIGMDISSSSSLDMEEKCQIPPQFEDHDVATSETTYDDLKEGKIPTPTLAKETEQDPSSDEGSRPPDLEYVRAATYSHDLSLATDTSTSTSIEETTTEFMALMPHPTNQPTTQLKGNNRASSSTFNGDEVRVEDKTGESASTRVIGMMSGGKLVSPVSSIDWANVTIEAHLEVPTSQPCINSAPDSVYQRYFQILHDLAYRSPPLPSEVLEAQLNNMVIGLQSLGYPLDTWLKAATLVLTFTKKREYIEHHVDNCKANVEAQLKEFASAIAPIKEVVSRSHSNIAILEEKQEKLDEIVAELEDQLAVLKTEQKEVMGSLTTARDQLAAAEATLWSVSIDMECLNQQYSAISDMQGTMLDELPSLAEAFNSSFKAIMTKKF